MSQIVAFGEADQIRGFALAGVKLIPARDPEEIVREWAALADDVAVLILTSAAHRVLREHLAKRPRLLWTVMPT